MKLSTKLSAGQIQNIVFTAIVAGAAVGLYLLSGRLSPASPALPAETSAPTAEAAAEEPFASVPEAVYLEQLRSNTSFRVQQNKDAANGCVLVYQSEKTGAAALSYTLKDGEIRSVTLSFVCRDKPPAKPKTAIEQRLFDDYPAFIAAQNDALYVLLPAALSACDLNDALIEPVLLRWYAGALSARDDGKNYEDTYLNCAFSAYPTKRGENDVVVCTLLLP